MKYSTVLNFSKIVKKRGFNRPTANDGDSGGN